MGPMFPCRASPPGEDDKKGIGWTLLHEPNSLHLGTFPSQMPYGFIKLRHPLSFGCQSDWTLIAYSTNFSSIMIRILHVKWFNYLVVSKLSIFGGILYWINGLLKICFAKKRNHQTRWALCIIPGGYNPLIPHLNLVQGKTNSICPIYHIPMLKSLYPHVINLCIDLYMILFPIIIFPLYFPLYIDL